MRPYDIGQGAWHDYGIGPNATRAVVWVLGGCRFAGVTDAVSVQATKLVRDVALLVDADGQDFSAEAADPASGGNATLQSLAVAATAPSVANFLVAVRPRPRLFVFAPPPPMEAFPSLPPAEPRRTRVAAVMRENAAREWGMAVAAGVAVQRGGPSR